MKQEEIINMFDGIASNYDLVNKVVSFGIDKRWRQKTIKETLKYTQPKKVLDIACGTGDMIEIWQTYDVEICGIDPSKEMLKIAQKKFPNVKFYNLFATNLDEIENSCADVISISFGIRNVVDIKKAINEFYRVLDEDGILVILEFTKSKQFLRKFVDVYTNKVLPKIGGILSNNEKAYKYLSKSIENFYTTQELIKLFENENFILVKEKSFNFGQVSLIILRKKS